MTSKPHILYLSFDGLLSPLGYSQVARVMKGLAIQSRRSDSIDADDPIDKGVEITICSLEREEDLQTPGRQEALERELSALGIRWRRRHWSDGGGVADVARNVAKMAALLRQEIRHQPVDLIHARSYVAASLAREIGGARRIPYLFDIRGYWVDERREQGRWFDGPLRLAAARHWEQRLYQDAAAIVSLTEEAAEEIRTSRLSPYKTQPPVVVIPTCVDYGEFGLGGPGSAAGISRNLSERLQASLVVGLVGAVEQAYCIEDSIRLFDHLRALRPDAHLLGLTRNSPALLTYLQAAGLPEDSYTLATATHEEMPAWLSHIDWGLLLRHSAPSHRAAMPTKLAEFFASGVRPIYWGCNREVHHWVERAGSGVSLDRLDEAGLRQAASEIAEHPAELDSLLAARWRTRKHFDLQEGIRRYQALYRHLLSGQQSRHLRVLFLTEGTDVPASRFRVQQFLPQFRRQGIECTLRSAYGKHYARFAQSPLGPLYKLAMRLKRLPQIRDAHRYDLVFLQRPALPFSAACEHLARLKNPNLILDVDDAIFLRPDGAEDPRQGGAFDRVVENCAHVIAGNAYLAERIRHTPATVIPTVLDTDRYRPFERPRRPEVVIGWMGTYSNFVSLEPLVPLLRRLLAEYPDLRVELVSNATFEPLKDHPGVDQIPWTAADEIPRLQNFDIGIMPLLDNPSTRGKCGFKAIQYMAVAVPVVASAVGANQEILANEEGGYLAETLLEFEVSLRRLIENRGLRERLGAAGRRRVLERYCIEAVLPQYLTLFDRIAAGRLSPREPVSSEKITSEGRQSSGA